MYKKLGSLLLVAALMLSLSGAGFEISDSVNLSDVTIGSTAESKVYSSATLEDDFADDRVLVTLTNTASLSLKEYSASDFSEIQCRAIADLSTATGKLVKAKLASRDVSTLGITNAETIAAMNTMDISAYNQVICLELEEPGKENVLKAIQSLQNREDVLCAEPDYTIYPCWTSSNDSYSGNQWAIANINLNQAWDITTGSSTVIVGVMDSGIDGTHPDLVNRINVDMSRDFSSTNNGSIYIDDVRDSDGHGTHVAGIIAAQGNNSTGISGVAWNVTLVSLKVFGIAGQESASNLINAVDYATSIGIPILNYSGSIDENITALKEKIASYNGLFICAAGNNGTNNDTVAHYPSNWELSNILVVGASTSSNSKAGFSNYGKTSVDIFAPGSSILSCYMEDKCALGGCDNESLGNIHYQSGYHYMDGTSMATPYVTGVAALIKAKYPNLSTAQIKQRIMCGIDSISTLSNLCVSGGRLNAYRALHNHTSLSGCVSDALYHTGTCTCGAVVTESHSFVSSGSNMVCSKCGYVSSYVINSAPDTETE